MRTKGEYQREWTTILMLIMLIMLVFASLYIVSVCLGGSNLEYGTLCHFFDLGNQRGELIPIPLSGGGAEQSRQAFLVACVVAIIGKIMLAGIFISWLVNWFIQGIAKVRQGLVRPVGYRDHVVLIGYRKGLTECLIRSGDKKRELLPTEGNNEKKPMYLLQTKQDVAHLRVRMLAHLGLDCMKRVRLVSGSRTVRNDLDMLSVEHCREIYLLGEEGEEEHDADSLACLDLILHGKNRLSERASCYLFWERPEASSLFQKVGLLEHMRRQQSVACRDLRAYNLHDLWAEHVLIGRGWREEKAGEAFMCPPLDREPITYNSTKRVHFIILGMSRLGSALARTAFHLAHFPNFLRDPSRKTLVTLIDENAEIVMNRMRNHDPFFFDELDYSCRECGGKVLRYRHEAKKKLLDLEVQFIQGRVETREIQDFLERSAAVPTDLVTIAVCFGDASLALSTALDLPASIRERGITVYVRQESNSNILQIARGTRRGNATPYACLHPIGMRETPLHDNVFDLLEPKWFNMIYHMCNARLNAKDPCVRQRIKKELCSFLPAHVRRRCPFRSKGRCELGEECASDRLGSRNVKDPSFSWKQFAQVALGLDLETGIGERVDTLDNAQIPGPWNIHEEWNRLRQVHHWSNRYLSSSVELKLRSLGWEGDDERRLAEVMISQLDTMSRIEHNRWVTERLLLGVSPEKHDCITLFDHIRKDKHLYDIILCLAICIVRECRTRKRHGFSGPG